MRVRRALLPIIFLVVPAHAPARAEMHEPVRSLLEIRRDKVVMQKWDLSCGAAALATLLNYQHGETVTEREVASGLINRPEYIANPMLVRARQGFSLLDLKRFADSRGYVGRGFGGLGLQQLVERAPIIVPVELHGYSHFVVFRGVRGNRVLLADPAYGNRTMAIARFESAWMKHGELGRVGFVVERADGAEPPNRLGPEPRDFVTVR